MTNMVIKRSLADEVAIKLTEEITSGHYKLNEKLPTEPALMKRFGVGRSTIREATKILANLGLLRIQQGVGTFVESIKSIKEPIDQRLKRAKIHDLDEVRQLLEMKIAEKAAQNRTIEDIKSIELHLAERKRTAEEGMLLECIEADINFHVAIAEASKNEILADLYKSASIHLKNWFLQIHADTKPFLDTYHLHNELLQNIVKGDSKKAWATAAKIIGHFSK